MPLPGQGFIALWNDVAPNREDYDAWHTIEHVPERMTIEGFLRACRYVLIAGPLPRYFTLYALHELAALDSAAYLHLVDTPTPWSRGMRPDMRNFIRRVCHTRLTQGGGIGGFAAIGLSRIDDSKAAAQACGQLSKMDGVSGAHFGSVDADARSLKVDVQQGSLPFEPRSIFVIEGYDPDALAESCQKAGKDCAAAIEAWSLYKLAFELRKDDLNDVTFPAQARLEAAGHHRSAEQ